ncbi:Uncharacterised protein [Mycobacteroides abscessus subsp. abscessus]|nr:Uncharacterised protein [Mycobacteroides abscessus subsp. abscessus]
MTELELGVGQDDSAPCGEIGSPAVDVERRGAQGLGEVGADDICSLLEGDVLVMITLLRLGRGSEDRFRQLVGLMQTRREYDAAHRAGLVVVDETGPGQIAAGDAFDGNHRQLVHHH